MDTLQILRALRGLPVASQGVFPADMLPMRWTPPATIVANTDPHSQPGSHWVAMYLDNDGHCVYFDSYGVPPGIP